MNIVEGVVCYGDISGSNIQYLERYGMEVHAVEAAQSVARKTERILKEERHAQEYFVLPLKGLSVTDDGICVSVTDEYERLAMAAVSRTINSRRVLQNGIYKGLWYTPTYLLSLHGSTKEIEVALKQMQGFQLKGICLGALEVAGPFDWVQLRKKHGQNGAILYADYVINEADRVVAPTEQCGNYRGRA